MVMGSASPRDFVSRPGAAVMSPWIQVMVETPRPQRWAPRLHGAQAASGPKATTMAAGIGVMSRPEAMAMGSAPALVLPSADVGPESPVSHRHTPRHTATGFHLKNVILGRRGNPVSFISLCHLTSCCCLTSSLSQPLPSPPVSPASGTPGTQASWSRTGFGAGFWGRGFYFWGAKSKLGHSCQGRFSGSKISITRQQWGWNLALLGLDAVGISTFKNPGLTLKNKRKL